MAGKKYVIPTVFKAIDEFTKPVRDMENAVSGLGNKSAASMARLDRSMRKISTRANRAGNNMIGMGTAIIAPMALSVKAAMDFEEQMSNVSTIIDTNTESIDDMGSKLLDVASRMPVKISDLTESLYNIRSAGIAADDQFGVLEASAKLSVAGLSTTTEAVDILTSAINSWGDDGLSATQKANILFKTVKAGKTTISELAQSFGNNAAIIESAGVSFTEFQAATAALTTTGQKASVAQTNLKASVSKLLGPTKEMETVFKSLGVKTGTELIKTSGGLVEAYRKILTTTDKLGLSQKKVFGSTEALGAAISLTGAQNKAFTATMKDMASTSDDLQVAFDKQANTQKAQFQIVKNQVQALAIEMGQALMPVIRDLLEALMPIVKSFAAWIKNNKELFKTIVVLVAKFGAFSIVLGGILKLIGPIWKGFMGFQKAFKFLPGALGAMGKFPKGLKLLKTGLMALPGPLKLVGLGVMGVVAGFKLFGGKAKEIGFITKAQNAINERTASLYSDQAAKVALLFAKLRALSPQTQEYTNVLNQLEQIQPGIIDKYNLTTGAVENLNRAEKELIATLEKKARVQASEELFQEAYKKQIEIEAKGGGPEEVQDVFFERQEFKRAALTAQGVDADKVGQIIQKENAAFINQLPSVIQKQEQDLEKIGLLEQGQGYYAQQSIDALVAKFAPNNNQNNQNNDATIKVEVTANENLNIDATSDNNNIQIQTSPTNFQSTLGQ